MTDITLEVKALESSSEGPMTHARAKRSKESLNVFIQKFFGCQNQVQTSGPTNANIIQVLDKPL